MSEIATIVDQVAGNGKALGTAALCAQNGTDLSDTVIVSTTHSFDLQRLWKVYYQ